MIYFTFTFCIVFLAFDMRTVETSDWPAAPWILVTCLFQESYSYVRSTAPAVAYDSKQYYQQPTATAAVAAAQPQPSVADSYYQTGMIGTHHTPV